ncbi:DUF6438 domain-containing protein [Flavobacterium buctense]|uniref:DUF6438 domain-containing protein n=1 Tax=Flavobacterium buctense TaxID=1648146 RepID=A0ABU9DXI2_9FLAO|nr:DUF6438 domain-containing protein [Flavobacterium buctense]
MRIVIFISFLLLFVSCKKEEDSKQNPFVGHWYFDKIVEYDASKVKMPKSYLEIQDTPYYNFQILNDSVINFKQGFYYFVENKIKSDTYGYDFLRSAYYLGTKTKYKIKDSKLLFFDETSKEWDTITIQKRSGDTMIVSGYYKASYRLVKKKNTYFNANNYDAVIVDRSPCFGSCPFNSTYIDRNGNFYFKGYDSNTQTGNFNSKLDKKTVDELFNSFDKIDIFKLKDNYFAMTTCSQTNVISFIKNGKIVKTISSYIECPIDLELAMTQLSYAYQKVKLNYDDQFIFDNEDVLFRFKTKGKDYFLKESEDFFLEVNLRNGKKVNLDFIPKYKLDFNVFEEKHNVKSIMTDGRYYKFINKDNTTFTVDIGYNFIDSNPILKKDRNF